MTNLRAPVFGFCAVLMWPLLALLTVKTSPIPPFQLTAMSFAIGGALGLSWVMIEVVLDFRSICSGRGRGAQPENLAFLLRALTA